MSKRLQYVATKWRDGNWKRIHSQLTLTYVTDYAIIYRYIVLFFLFFTNVRKYNAYIAWQLLNHVTTIGLYKLHILTLKKITTKHWHLLSPLCVTIWRQQVDPAALNWRPNRSHPKLETRCSSSRLEHSTGEAPKSKILQRKSEMLTNQRSIHINARLRFSKGKKADALYFQTSFHSAKSPGIAKL